MEQYYYKPETPLLTINDQDSPVVTIKRDGTVVVHKEGGDKEAAKIFYEILEAEGRRRLNRLKELPDEIVKTLLDDLGQNSHGLPHAKELLEEFINKVAGCPTFQE